MFIKKTAFFLFSFLFSFSLLAQSGETTFIEKVTRKADELVIPYEKYVLANGLTLIVHEDHSDPIVYVDITYHVGSANEQEGRSGFAHFFEHMMFQGSEHVGDEQHFKIITEAGGTLNGSTSADRTNYWEVLPSNQLETAFWLESDRMGYFLDSVTQQKFEIQRATVKNEREQRYDNRPYGLAWEKMDAALYPPSHPYSWQTIGYIEDLNRVDVNDLKKFFLRWYGPNNATLTVAGDVSAAEVVKLAEKYFGTIPKGPEVKPQYKEPIVLAADRYLSYEDNIRAPQIIFTFPTVPSNHPDEAPLDVLADILAGGKSSVFYQNFVKTQKAQFAYVAGPCQELAGEFMIMVRTFPDNDLSSMDSLIRASLIEFEKRGVKEEDLIKFKAGNEADVINALASVKGKGTMLAAYQTFSGNPNRIVEDLKRYNAVSKEDVIRVYEKYIKNKPAVILSVCPKGMAGKAAKADNYQLPERNIANPEGEEYKNLVYNKSPVTFDRNQRPVVSAANPVTPPHYETFIFENGLQVISAQNKEVPMVSVQIYLKAGHFYEPLKKAGIAELLANMLNESTEKHSAEELGEILERLGSDIVVDNNGEDLVLEISALTKNIDTTLALATEILFQPKFDPEEYEIVKNQQLESIANQSTQATTIAGNLYAQLLYGSKNVSGLSVLGTGKTIKPIRLDDVKKYYAQQALPNISKVVIVSNLEPTIIVEKLDFLKGRVLNAKHTCKTIKTPVVKKTKIYFVNKESAPQSEIRIGCIAMPYDVLGEYYKASIMNYVLGGAFNSRINLNLREEHGYTYGARSGFSGNKYMGHFSAGAGVKGNVTDSALMEFMKEIKNYVDNGITPEELAFTKTSIGQSEALKYETNDQKGVFINRILDYHLKPDFVERRNAVLQNISKEEIDALAKKHIPYNNLIIVVVGDKATVFNKLKTLGYEVIELNEEGNKIKK